MCDKTTRPALDYADSRIEEQRERDMASKQIGYASRPYTDDEKLAEIFRYHSPNETTIPKYEHLRAAAKYFAQVILLTVPPGADRTCALRHVRDAVMTANSGVALNGLSF